MSVICRECKTAFEPTPGQKRWICKPCVRAYDKQYRARRKVEGRPVVSGKMSKEWHAAYEKQYRKRPDVRTRLAAKWHERIASPEERHKYECRWKTQRAIESGKLIRQPCEVCSSVPTDAHHDDYTKPLDVRWLCRQCHTDLHAKPETTKPAT